MSLEEVKERVKAYGLTRLANEIDLTRQTLYNFLSSEDMRLSSFMKVLSVLEIEMIFDSDLTDDDVRANLKRWGAPLVASKTSKKLSLEKTLFLALDSVSRDGRLTSVLAFLLTKKASQVKWSELLDDLSSVREHQLLGYLLDLSLCNRHRTPLSSVRDLLKKKSKSFNWEAVNKRDAKKPAESFERYKNELASAWKLKVRENPKDAVKRMRKWESQGEATA